MDKRLLGEYLITDQTISKQQLERALETQATQTKGGHMPLIGTILVEMGALSDRELVRVLERQERDRKAIGV